MPKNRVEELEATVAELQSTVRGLTEELVESKERIRVLEAELDTDTPTRVPDRRNDDEEAADDGAAAEAEPGDVAAATAEANPSDDGEDTDEAEDSGIDDIIVA